MQLLLCRMTLHASLAMVAFQAGRIAYSFFGPSPPIVVSRETTYLTEPLDEHGHIDYIEAVRRRWTEGVTPENNAAVLLWQAAGPRRVDKDMREQFFAELGIPALPKNGDYFVSVTDDSVQQRGADWVLSQQEVTRIGMPPEPREYPWLDIAPLRANGYPSSSSPAQRRLDAMVEFMGRWLDAADQPWRADEIPPFAEWLAQNEKPLELVAQACQRPRYYSPLVLPEIEPGVRNMLVVRQYSDMQVCRRFAYALRMRAMLHLGHGRSKRAWDDLKAIHNLARLVQQDESLISQLCAGAIDGIALSADTTLLHEAQLAPKELNEIRAFLGTLHAPMTIRQSISEFDRIQALDAVVHTARFGVKFDWDESSMLGIFGVGVDWNIALRIINRWYNRLVEAASLEKLADRRAAAREIERDLENLGSDESSRRSTFEYLTSRYYRSEATGKIFVALFVPSLSQALDAEARRETSLRLVQVAAALTVHRAENGDYPANLNELSQRVRDDMPVDLFTDESFLYEKRGEGYVLYSVGENLTDDNASGAKFYTTLNGELVSLHELDDAGISPEPDDIVLRVPSK